MQTNMLATGRIALRRTTEGSSISSRGAPYHNGLCKLPSLRQFRQNVGMRCSAAQPKKLAKRLEIVATYPEPETEKERSPIDFPQVSSCRHFPTCSTPTAQNGSTAFETILFALMTFGSSPNAILTSITLSN